ncbi:hypothetical protein OG772_20565 [Streptomyces sp. NBC_01321]|uniref:hypothetical protein n=1 Tax=Streptomyces sp. NBC_01321 TaxID=2903825 RepID=UPI002E0F727C|nr:hypothetical protein OG772_20565 [Streptomyces sp. NBC_01321]
MTAVPEEQMPFRVSFDSERGQLVLMLTFGVQPRQRVTSELIPSVEAAAVQIALNRHEARMRAHLADAIAEATTRFLGADPQRLEAAVAALSDPTSAVPIGSILRVDGAPADPRAGSPSGL